MKTSQYSNYRAIILSLSYLILFLSFPSPSQSAKPKCNAQDKKVLLQIKAALNITSWIPDIECCDWYGLECDRNTSRVISLAIFNNDISGQIPPAVGDLPYLKTIDMRKLPYLVGEIPPAISKLSQLTFLRLDWNNLSGPVPSFLSQLKNLYFLDLSFNKFSGSIPPSLSELPNLLALHLDRNKLTGNIPESFGNFPGNGKTPDLFLSHNMLTGPIPRSLGNLNFSGTIDLSRNRLEGDPSFLFGKSKTVLFVDLSRNLFEFDLSKVEFPENMTNLDLNHNKIFGSLPEGLIKMQLLNVSYNRLCGQIPQGGDLQSFDSTAYFHNRCLCGAPLPPCKK